MSSTEGAQVTVEEVRQQNAKVLQLIDIAKLLPPLKEKGILTEEIIKKVSDAKHHTQFERSNFLLSFLYQKGQVAIDGFIASLREAETPNHAEILRLLEGELVDSQLQSPLFTILEGQLSSIIRSINLVSLLKSLLTLQAIPLSTFLDLQNNDRTLKETLERLFPMLEMHGTRGFISFLSALQKDLPNPGHEKLSEILFAEVKKFFKEHPQRDLISQSDRIEILQLERRDKVIGQEVHQRILRHRDTLVDQINVPALLPSLLKHQVITKQDADYLSQTETQTESLLDLLLDKELSFMVKFAESLKESPVNREAGELLLASPQGSMVMKKPVQSGGGKHEKVAVFVSADYYLSRNGLPTSLEPMQFDQPVKEHRETLKRQLASKDFHVIHFDTNIDDDQLPRAAKEGKDKRAKVITERFIAQVASKCMDEAIVFLFLSGIQFPIKTGGSSLYSGAVLRTNASKFGRLSLDSIECSDLVEWVREMPGSHVTILIDTDPSHAVSYDKTRQVSQVEIMESPWLPLVSPEANTVVLYLQPDPAAIADSRGPKGRGIGSPLGLLTETVTKAIVSCVLKNKEELVSHRSLYEAVSFYWHSSGNGRLHPLFIPAMAGAMDRCFLDKTSLPNQQAFRADLTRTTSGDDMFVNSVKLTTGTMAGLIQGDQLELFHVLRPRVRVSGRVTESFHLHCVGVIDEGDWTRLLDTLTELYKGELCGVSRGLEFVLARKKFPLHQRLAVYPRELERGDTNTLKTYIKERSNLLAYVPQETNAAVVVSFVEQVYHVKDVRGDIKYPMMSSSMEKVKSMLEIIARFKYVKGLKSRQRSPHLSHDCFITVARPLLSTAAPLCREFEIFRSSYVRVHSSSLGYEAILKFTDPPQFWTPAKADPTPSLTVQFKQNRIITAVELRGDPTHSKFVKEATVTYRKTILKKVVDCSKPSLDLATDEIAGFIVFQLSTVDPEAQFSITFKLKAKRPKSKSGYVDQLWVNRPWPFIPAWSLKPGIAKNGCLTLDTHQLTWNGVGGGGEMALHLGMATSLDKIEFIALTGVKELVVCLETQFPILKTDSFTSSYPRKYAFQRPIIASMVTIQPTKFGENPSPTPPPPMMSDAGDTRVQLQLHGNTHGEAMDVDEGGVINVQFNALSDKQLFFYILCLEETGAISFLNEGEEEAPEMYQQMDLVTVCPPAKLLLGTEIPQGYKPEAGHIRDEYRVWVSPSRLCVEPFLQTGVHNYHLPIAYNVCTTGYRTGDVVDEWFDHHYTVRVRKS